MASPSPTASPTADYAASGSSPITLTAVSSSTTLMDEPALSTLPPIIPPTHPARTLVLCFDGTGDQFDSDNSNVIQFFQMLQKDNRREQMVYYQAGIGTYTIPQIATPFLSNINKTLDAMIAWNLDAHVMGGYEFLMQNYEAGDKICIFGFSRGAYTARALAGMIHKVGLIPACNHQQVPFAYKMFTRTDELGWKQSTAFKKAFSVDVDIEFVGVWDTVCSVGLIPRTLPFTASNTSIKIFRHAVSLDEHRAKFKANLFHRPTKHEAGLGTQAGDMPKSRAPPQRRSELESMVDTLLQDAGIKHGKENGTTLKRKDLQRQFDAQFSTPGTSAETDILEVWFSGCHCDVGGGSVSNDTPHSLARIPLRWMIRQCFLTNTGIRFHTDLLAGAGLDPAALFPTVLPRPPPVSASPNIVHTPESTQSSVKTLVHYADAVPARLSEEEEDLADLLSPVYDQLALAPSWWVLEFLPMQHKVQQGHDKWVDEPYMNMGRARALPKAKRQEPLYVHRTVKLRMEAEGLEGGPYVPRLQGFPTEPTWVD